MTYNIDDLPPTEPIDIRDLMPAKNVKHLAELDEGMLLHERPSHARHRA